MFDRPSRRVPGTVRLGLIIGGRSTFFGWFLIGLGLCFVWSYGGDNLLRDWAYFRGDLGVVHGTITSVVYLSKDRRAFTEHHYSYNIKGVAYAGMTEGMYGHYVEGDKVEIEYALFDSVRSRIRGLSTTRRGLFAVTFIPVVGVILVLRGMLKALKGCYLLAHGTLTSGTLIAKTPTLDMDHNKRIYKFVFSFRSDDGTTYKVNARAPLSERPGSRIAYDARNPRRAVLLADLPGRPGINERDDVTTATPAWLALLLVGPAAIVVVGHVYWAFHVCEIL